MNKKIGLSVSLIVLLTLLSLLAVKYFHHSTPKKPTAQKANVVLLPAAGVDKTWPEWKAAEDLWQEISARRQTTKSLDANALTTLLQAANDKAAKGESCDAATAVRQTLEMGADDAGTWLIYSDLQHRCNESDTASSINDLLIAETRNPTSEQLAKLYQKLSALYATLGDASKAQTIAAIEKSLKIQADPTLQLQLSALRGEILNIEKTDVTNDNDAPVACITFSWPLQDDGSVAYQNFISTEPAIKLAATPAGKQLCLRGFTYGQEYSVTLKSGLPASGVAKLQKDEIVHVSVKDRDSHLNFQANTYILPRLNNLGIPIKGINVDVAQVEVLYINDRNLVNQIVDGHALSSNDYEISQIRNNHGHTLWKGFVNLKRVNNQTTTTAIPFMEMIKQATPGLYMVVATPATRKTEQDTNSQDKNSDYVVKSDSKNSLQWIVVTDVGLTVYKGEDGIQVIARSYNTGKPLPNVQLKLLSRDNTILTSAETDSEGHAHFAQALFDGKEGHSVKLLQATAGTGDFTFIDLNQPNLDLSDSHVDGRAAVKKFDTYLYSDRGIYRPGDSVHFSILLRDRNAKAFSAAPPLTVKIQPPNNAPFNPVLLKAHDIKLGGYHTTIKLPENAHLGVWHFFVYADPTEPSIGDYAVQVEDFVPARMKVKITMPNNAMLKKGESLAIPVQADYLYGAPVKNASGDASLDIVQVKDSPFPKFSDYQFGLLTTPFTAVQQKLTLGNTDDKGVSTLDVKLDTLPASSSPLQAVIHASLFDDTGRAVNNIATIPVTRTEPFLGIKTLNDGTDTQEGWDFRADRNFSVIALDRSGNRVAANKLRYSLVREEYHYDWFADNEERNYVAQTVDVPIKSGVISIDANNAAKISVSDLHYGTYRLDVIDPSQTTDKLTATSTKFNVGWMERALSEKDKPDSVQLRLDHPNYRAGQSAKLFVKAPFAGLAEVVIANETVLSKQLITLPATGTTVTIPVGNDWGPGAYALVHAYRPGEKLTVAGKNQSVPGRAVGAIWLAMDMSPRIIQIQITTPEKITPNQTIQVPVQLSGVSTAEVTLAAVDEGILSLTDFNSPDPAKDFYAKRRLGVEILDSYGRLLDPRVDALGHIHSGGDGAEEPRVGAAASRNTSALPNKWIKPIALFSGAVTVDANGHALIPLTIPEFNGQLRLMAVAYNANQVGHADKKLIVRNKVVVNLGLPRFLAPGDNADLTLNIDNLDGNAGIAHIKLTTTGGIQLADYPTHIQLASKQKQQIHLKLNAQTLGNASVQLTFTSPEGKIQTRDWPLSVRSIQNYQDKVITGVLKPNHKINLTDKLLHSVIPNDAMVSLTLNGVPDLQLGRTIKSLDRYPYGCLEQTSSRLLPLLYLPEIADKFTGKDKKDMQIPSVRIDEAVNHILSMQRSDGSFALWDNDGPTEDFLTLYAIDVMQRAAEQNVKVPEIAMKNALRWVKNQISQGDFATPILDRRAYAYYLLAKAGLIEPGQVRYFAERYGADFSDRLSNAFTAAALNQIGDNARAKPFWQKALAATSDKSNWDEYNDYGSNLRDRLITLTLFVENKQDIAQAITYAEQLNAELASNPYLSTQEQGWLILAAHSLFASEKEMHVLMNEKPAMPDKKGQPLIKNWQGPDWKALQSGVALTNTGSTNLHYSIAINGIPKTTQPASSHGFTLQRHYFTRDGKPADLNTVQNNQMLIVLIEGEVKDKHIVDQCLLVDLLPAGLELESAQFGAGQNVDALSWLGTLSTPVYQALQDDRFVVSFDPNSINSAKSNASSDDSSDESNEESNAESSDDSQAATDKKFRFAYVVRAVTPGHYQLPATTVEAMYRPQFNARIAPGTLDIH